MKQKLSDRNKAGIYLIRNKINGKVYIGKSIRLYKRIKGHVTHLNTKSKDENRHLINAWHKYGREAFEYEVLEYLPKDEEILRERELYWMVHYNSTDREKGYNMRMDTSTKCIVQEESRARLSASGLKRFDDPKEREKLSEMIKQAKNTIPVTDEYRKRLSQALKEFKVLQFEKSGELLYVWDSVTDVLDNNPDYKRQNIYASCNGGKPTGYGYLWRYWDKDEPVPDNITASEIETVTKGKTIARTVYCFDDQFNFLESYKSCGEASRKNNLASKTISSTCRGDKRTHYHARHYWYYETTLPENLKGLINDSSL